MKYTQIPADTFEHLQLNAGILVDSFDPATGEVSGLRGASSGGFSFDAQQEKKDYGEDIDNCPPGMMELMKGGYWDAKISGTYVSVTSRSVKSLLAAADIDEDDTTKIVPRNDLKSEDFEDIWWVGDYSDVNEDESGKTAGFIAIHMKNSLSTGGFKITTSDGSKGQFAFEYKAHYSLKEQKKPPFEIYVKVGA